MHCDTLYNDKPSGHFVIPRHSDIDALWHHDTMINRRSVMLRNRDTNDRDTVISSHTMMVRLMVINIVYICLVKYVWPLKFVSKNKLKQ